MAPSRGKGHKGADGVAAMGWSGRGEKEKRERLCAGEPAGYLKISEKWGQRWVVNEYSQRGMPGAHLGRDPVGDSHARGARPVGVCVH